MPWHLFGAPGDSGFGQVVGGHLHGDFIARQDADKIGPQFAGDVCQHRMAIGLALFVEQLDLEHSVGHSLADDAFYFDDIFFRQADCLLEGSFRTDVRHHMP